jgi:excisionase family DNA binding protein
VRRGSAQLRSHGDEAAQFPPVLGGRLLRVREVAARLAVSTRTIQTWIALGRFHPIRLSARALRIAESEVEELIRKSAS